MMLAADLGSHAPDAADHSPPHVRVPVKKAAPRGPDAIPLPSVKTEHGTNDGLSYAVAWSQGYRPEQEDAHMTDLLLSGNMALFCVFDGHGGKEVAAFCARHVREAVKRSQAFIAGIQDRTSAADALREAVQILDEEVIKRFDSSVGSTATLVLLHDHEVVVAGVGDSRCVLGRQGKPQALTVDHKPTDPKEADRIKKAGGFVVRGRVGANLNMSRAIGDADYKDQSDLAADQQQVTSTPDVRAARLNPDAGDDFLIAATDGLWNAVRQEQAVAHVHRRLKDGASLEAVATELCNQANRPGNTARDNVTVTLVAFKQLPYVASDPHVMDGSAAQDGAHAPLPPSAAKAQ